MPFFAAHSSTMARSHRLKHDGPAGEGPVVAAIFAFALCHTHDGLCGCPSDFADYRTRWIGWFSRPHRCGSSWWPIYQEEPRRHSNPCPIPGEVLRRRTLHQHTCPRLSVAMRLTRQSIQRIGHGTKRGSTMPCGSDIEPIPMQRCLDVPE